MISIVIPTYKRSDVISRAIDSVLNQTYENIEIIVVSDGFDRPTDKIMKKYSDNDKIKYYYYPNNRGGNYARNFGIDKAKGNYIAFLDDDDLWDQTKLKKQLDVFKDNPNVGLVYTGKRTIFPELNISYDNIPIELGDLSEKIFYKNFIGSTSNVMIKKNILDKAGRFDEELYAMQDRDLWIRVCQITEIGAVKEPLFFYYNDSENDQISTSIKKREAALERILNKNQSLFLKNPKLKNAFEKGTYQSIIRIAQRNNDLKSLKKYNKLFFGKYNDIKSYIFLISTKIPYNLILKIRSYI